MSRARVVTTGLNTLSPPFTAENSSWGFKVHLQSRSRELVSQSKGREGQQTAEQRRQTRQEPHADSGHNHTHPPFGWRGGAFQFKTESTTNNAEMQVKRNIHLRRMHLISLCRWAVPFSLSRRPEISRIEEETSKHFITMCHHFFKN